MVGNVWAWIADCWNKSYKGAPTDGSPWTSGTCVVRIVRGGSWYNNPDDLRSANRYRDTAVDRVNNVGFRVARTLTRHGGDDGQFKARGRSDRGAAQFRRKRGARSHRRDESSLPTSTNAASIEPSSCLGPAR